MKKSKVISALLLGLSINALADFNEAEYWSTIGSEHLPEGYKPNQERLIADRERRAEKQKSTEKLTLKGVTPGMSAELVAETLGIEAAFCDADLIMETRHYAVTFAGDDATMHVSTWMGRLWVPPLKMFRELAESWAPSNRSMGDPHRGSLGHYLAKGWCRTRHFSLKDHVLLPILKSIKQTEKAR